MTKITYAPVENVGTVGIINQTAFQRKFRELFDGRSLLGRFSYLVATQAITVAVGIGYWTVGARFFDTAQVGIAAAAMSAATLIAMFGVFGVTSVLLVSIGNHDADEQRILVFTSLLVACGFVAACTTVAWPLTPYLGPSLGTIGRNLADSCLVLVGAVATTAASVVDAAALGMKKSAARLVRNTVAAVLKVLCILTLALLDHRTSTDLLFGWDASIVISFVVCPYMMKMTRNQNLSLTRCREYVLLYWRTSLGHHAVNIAIGSISYILPVLVSIFILPREVAYFSVAQLISSGALLIAYFLTISLFVESSGDAMLLRKNVRCTFPLGLACSGVIIAVLVPTAHLVLSIFSYTFAQHATIPLQILLLAGIPYVVKDHYVAIRRSQGRLSEAARVAMSSTLFEATIAGVGAARWGLQGLCIAWVIATYIEGALFLPAILSVIRTPVLRVPTNAEVTR